METFNTYKKAYNYFSKYMTEGMQMRGSYGQEMEIINTWDEVIARLTIPTVPANTFVVWADTTAKQYS